MGMGLPGGGVPPGSPNPDPISDQKMSFFTPVFRPDLQSPYQLLDLASKKLCHHYLDWNTKKNDFLIRTFLFLSYSFGVERINTFKHSRCPLENHTRFQTKMDKVYTRFQTKTAQKPYSLGQHIPIELT